MMLHNENKYELGIVFIVNNKIKEIILDLNIINKRIFLFKFKGKFFNLLIIITYIEAEKKNKIDIKKFSIINYIYRINSR